ncbi:MAG TPA: glyoxalase [Cyanothece sp. UBA12306]|nr:glyoxalase [Cyanothece sp. UBA12306]
MKLNYRTAFITIATVNFDRLVNFYSKILQQNPNPYLPKSYAQFQLYGLKLGIFYPKSDHQLEFSNCDQSSVSICLEVDNLEEAIAFLNQLEVTFSDSIIEANHGQEIYGYDPDGNRLILVELSP